MPSEPDLRLFDEQVRELAGEYGTPLYVVDETVFRQRIQTYREALERSWPTTRLAYASKANSHIALLRIAHQEGCLIDAASEGEIEAALRAGVPPSWIQLHGSNKALRELSRAIDLRVREIIVDNFHEIGFLSELAQRVRDAGIKLSLRLAPGVDPITHKRISTGQEDTKFGFNIADGSAKQAVELCLESGLPLVALHAHVGSQLLDPEAQILAAERIAEFASSIKADYDLQVEELNFGGGLGIQYVQAQTPLAIPDYVRQVNDSAAAILKKAGLKVTITHEPGRALIGPAGVTIYEVGAVKAISTERNERKVYLSVNGGLADNPRPSLYDAVYTVVMASADPERALVRDDTVPVTISGRHCETDTLFESCDIPRNTRPGDFAQVLATGAYNNSMASNYNRYPRPRMVLIRSNGKTDLIQESDSYDHMFALETIPEGL